jgi:hypothetical protein
VRAETGDDGGGAWVNRKDDRLVDAVEAFDDALEAFGVDVCFAVDRADEVALRRYVEALEDIRA